MLQIAIVLIGTPRAAGVLAGGFRQARRSSGLGSFVLSRMSLDDEFVLVCKVLWENLHVRKSGPLTDEIISTLYDLSQGIIDLLVKLIILTELRSMARENDEMLTPAHFRSVFCDCFKLVAPHVVALNKGGAAAEMMLDEVLPSFELGVFQVAAASFLSEISRADSRPGYKIAAQPRASARNVRRRIKNPVSNPRLRQIRRANGTLRHLGWTPERR